MSNLASRGVRFIVAPTAPDSFELGQVGLWSPDSGPNANKLLLRNADGTDTVVGGGGGGSQKLQSVYNTGANSSDSLITLDSTRQGIGVDIDGHLTGSGANAFSVYNSSVLDPTGNPNGFHITANGELKGSYEVAFRHRLMLFGGDNTDPCDAAIRITPALSTSLPAGILILGAQDAVNSTTQAGGQLIMVPGKGGGNVGGINGFIMLGQPGSENTYADDANAPYLFIDGPPNANNLTNGNGMAFRGYTGGSSNAFTFSTVNSFAASSNPVLQILERTNVIGEFRGPPDHSFVVYGHYGNPTAALDVRSDARDTGALGTGMTLNAGASGGHTWGFLSRGSGSTAGMLSFYDYTVGGVSGERLSILADGTLRPGVDAATTAGDSTHRFLATWSFQYLGVEQTIAAAASVTVNPTLGETIRITLSATAITSLTVSAGSPGQMLRIHVIQDGTGGRTIPTTWTNVRFPGGTYTASAGANKVDLITLSWDNTASKWDADVSLNLS